MNVALIYFILKCYPFFRINFLQGALISCNRVVSFLLGFWRYPLTVSRQGILDNRTLPITNLEGLRQISRGTQQKILRKRLKNNKKARIKTSEAILSILGDCWEKFICSSLPARLMKSGVPSQQGAPSTSDLTYLEVS